MIHADLRLSSYKDNPFVHIITDEQLHPDIHDNEYVRILKKIGNISLTNHVHGAICRSYGELNGSDFEDLIDRLKSTGYSYACFWFEGCQPMEGFEEEFIEWANDNDDWHIMGHILNRPNRFPVFHEQVIIVNLKNIDRLYFGEVDGDSYPKYEQSIEHIHDDYTPLWVKGTGGFFEFDNIEEEMNHMFDHMLFHCIRNGWKIVNVPENVRQVKFCVYPEDDVEHTLSWLTNHEFHKKSYDEKSQYKFDHVPHDKWMLYEFLNMSNEILYVTNTEDYPEEKIVKQAKDTNVIICPASGLNQFLFAMPHIDTLEKIVWADFNPMSIRWLQHIIDTWDGKNFRQFFEDSKPLLLEWGLKDLEFLNYRDKQVDELTEMFNTEEINAKYNRLRKIEHVFLNIDIVRQYEQILPHVKDSNVILQLSNIYSYEINYIVNKYFLAQSAFYGLVNGLLENNTNVYLRGDTPQGTYYEMTNIGKLGSL